MTKTPKKEESKALKSQNTPKIKKRKPRIERVLKKQEPLLTENTKRLLIMKGKHTSQIIVEVLRDLVIIITETIVSIFMYFFLLGKIVKTKL